MEPSNSRSVWSAPACWRFRTRALRPGAATAATLSVPTHDAAPRRPKVPSHGRCRLRTHPFDPRLLQVPPGDTGSGAAGLVRHGAKCLYGFGGLALASAVSQPSQRVHATLLLPKNDSDIGPRAPAAGQNPITQSVRCMAGVRVAAHPAPSPSPNHPQPRHRFSAALEGQPIHAPGQSPNPLAGVFSFRGTGAFELAAHRAVSAPRWVADRTLELRAQVCAQPVGLSGLVPLTWRLRAVTEPGSITLHVPPFGGTTQPARWLGSAHWRPLCRPQCGIEAICPQRLHLTRLLDLLRVQFLSGMAVLGLWNRISVLGAVRITGVHADSWYPRLMRD